MRVGGVALVAAVLIACSSDRPDEEGRSAPPAPGAQGTAPAAVQPLGCEGLEERILPVRPTREALRARFGAPDSVIGVAQPNRHVAGVTDSIFTVHYPGL